MGWGVMVCVYVWDWRHPGSSLAAGARCLRVQCIWQGYEGKAIRRHLMHRASPLRVTTLHAWFWTLPIRCSLVKHDCYAPGAHLLHID